MFSSALYPFFRNDDGTPQTTRDGDGLPRDSNGLVIILYTCTAVAPFPGATFHVLTELYIHTLVYSLSML